LDRLLEQLSETEAPESFDIEKSLIALGCDAREAALLADYLPSACGRAFVRELGVITSENGIEDDPLWREVEAFAETIRTDPRRRRQFGLVARQSAEADAINNALNDGMTLEDLRGAVSATAFVAPREEQSDE
jgi:hypothetical protein